MFAMCKIKSGRETGERPEVALRRLQRFKSVGSAVNSPAVSGWTTARGFLHSNDFTRDIMKNCLPSVYRLWVLLTLIVTPNLGAQPAVDASMGVGGGIGGPRARNRDLVGPSATVAFAVRDAPRGNWLVALSGVVTFSLEGGYCLDVPPPYNTPRSCSLFPIMGAAAVLAGWSPSTNPGRGFRLLGGPAFVSKSNDTHENGMGFMVQADGAAPIVKHLSFVGSARGLLAPRWYGQYVIGTVTLNAGFRVY